MSTQSFVVANDGQETFLNLREVVSCVQKGDFNKFIQEALKIDIAQQMSLSEVKSLVDELAYSGFKPEKMIEDMLNHYNNAHAADKAVVGNFVNAILRIVLIALTRGGALTKIEKRTGPEGAQIIKSLIKVFAMKDNLKDKSSKIDRQATVYRVASTFYTFGLTFWITNPENVISLSLARQTLIANNIDTVYSFYALPGIVALAGLAFPTHIGESGRDGTHFIDSMKFAQNIIIGVSRVQRLISKFLVQRNPKMQTLVQAEASMWTSMSAALNNQITGDADEVRKLLCDTVCPRLTPVAAGLVNINSVCQIAIINNVSTIDLTNSFDVVRLPTDPGELNQLAGFSKFFDPTGAPRH